MPVLQGGGVSRILVAALSLGVILTLGLEGCVKARKADASYFPEDKK